MQFTRETITPDQTKPLLHGKEGVWAYRYRHPREQWELVIATLAPPGSDYLSLGGFRIVPAARASMPGFNALAEATGLAAGMDEKVYWSRLLKIGGPRGMSQINRVVGGKCVLLPSNDSRIGQTKDREMLDFAAACLADAESEGFNIVTGQDLGHGMMSSGGITSLQFLHKVFDGSVLEDTSQPTGEGNFAVLLGMLRGFNIDLNEASVGFIGCGNVGERVVRRALDHGVTATAIEINVDKVQRMRSLGVEMLPPSAKESLLSQDLDAIVLNANGGTLDSRAVDLVCANRRLKAICGSENLCMPDELDEQKIVSAGKAYCPTELGGMMGYLTAVEEYLCRKSGVPFDVHGLIEAASLLEEPVERAVEYVVKNPGSSISDALHALY